MHQNLGTYTMDEGEGGSGTYISTTTDQKLEWL